MSFLPARREDHGGDLSPRKAARAQRAREATELAIYEHGLRTMAAAEFDMLDSEALASAVDYSTRLELDFLLRNMLRAGQSAAAASIVATKLDILTTTDNSRIVRRFGVR